MLSYYILNGHQAVKESDPLKWGEWFANANRRVADSTGTVKVEGRPMGTVRVSTVFLGLDHNYLGRGKPLLFETMVFGGLNDGEQIRTSTWEAAEQAHEQMIERVQLTCKII